MPEKVIAYITAGDKLLLFRHPHHPEAGIQVPAGTVEEGESLEAAVLREAREETGLGNLAIRSYLGLQEVDLSALGLSGVQRRHFFHLALCGDAPARWRHDENYPSDGSAGPIEFEFFWARFPNQVPELAGGQGEMFSKLEKAMRQPENVT
ncbi:MAG: NUDIX domain-containing protein [Anaerolineae bacterium]|nr:MAG: NUDIX domain-containing protein [Anaerolineae bacterium]